MQKVSNCLDFCSQITLWNKAFPKSATSEKCLGHAAMCGIPCSGRGCSQRCTRQFGRAVFGNVTLVLGRAVVGSSHAPWVLTVPRGCPICLPSAFLLSPICFSPFSQPFRVTHLGQQPPHSLSPIDSPLPTAVITNGTLKNLMFNFPNCR